MIKTKDLQILFLIFLVLPFFLENQKLRSFALETSSSSVVTLNDSPSSEVTQDLKKIQEVNNKLKKSSDDFLRQLSQIAQNAERNNYVNYKIISSDLKEL